MIDINNLSPIVRERLVSIYNNVRDIVMSNKSECNNWVKQEYFIDSETGFPSFVENLALSVKDGDIDWYSEDENIIEWLIHELRVVDFIYK